MDYPNKVQSFVTDFITDTGLDYKTNIDTYIQYAQARLLDQWMQQQNELMNQLIAEVKKLDTV